MSNVKTEETLSEIATNEETTRKYLLSDETFAILTEAQSKIREATEITPTLRKLINELVTQESVEKLTHKFIEKLS